MFEIGAFRKAQHTLRCFGLVKFLTLPGLKTRGFLKSPESELQRRCQIASTDSA